MKNNPYSSFFDQNISALIEKRRELHKIAEVSNQEEQTAAQIEKWLKETDPDELITNLGGYGIAAVYGKDESGPCTLFRAELDGLPIPDEIDADYTSLNPETGHKCGHDGHMANLLGLAEWLKEHPPVNGKVILLFQPAEETGEGAKRILDDPKYEKLNPGRVVALHNLPGYSKHSIIVKKGIFSSASEGMIIKLKGASSHAAHPENGNSPVHAMNRIMDMLHSLAGNDLPETSHALATIVHAKLGEIAFGTTPGSAVVMATLRAKATEDLDRMLDLAEKRAELIALTWDLKNEISYTERFEATINDSDVTSHLIESAENLGLELIEPYHSFPWSEDFGRFTGTTPGLLFGLGAGASHPQLHNPDYDYPDELIITAVSLFIDLKEKLHD